MDCKTLAVALIVACAGSAANAATYSSPLSGAVDVCLPDAACVITGPWFGTVVVTTNEGGDGLFSGADLQSISVDSYAYPGPNVTLLDFYSDGFGMGVDGGSAAAWPIVSIWNGQISDIEEFYTGGVGQWDFSSSHVRWTGDGDVIVAFAAIGAVPEASGRGPLMLGLAVLVLLWRAPGLASRSRHAWTGAPADPARGARSKRLST